VTAKADVMKSLDSAWDELRSLIDSMSQAEMLEPGVVDEWSVKDLLGHIAFWADRAANTLTMVAAGRGDKVPGPETEDELNEWNAREAAAREGKTLEELRTDWERAHGAARAALEGFPEDKLDEPFKERTVVFSFGADTFAHYQEHLSQIREWLRQMETTEA
jgi:uncharacterized protein (TIGR03083 family)